MIDRITLSVSEQVDGLTVSVGLQLSLAAAAQFPALSSALTAAQDSACEESEAVRSRLLEALRPLLPGVRDAALHSLQLQSLAILRERAAAQPRIVAGGLAG